MSKEESDNILRVVKKALLWAAPIALFGWLFLSDVTPAFPQENPTCSVQEQEATQVFESYGLQLETVLSRFELDDLEQEGILPPNLPSYIQELHMYTSYTPLGIPLYFVIYTGEGCYYGQDQVPQSDFYSILDYLGESN